MGLYLLYPMLYRITLQCPFLAVRTGLEPVTSCVTGRHSNQAELTHQKIKTSLFALRCVRDSNP